MFMAKLWFSVIIGLHDFHRTRLMMQFEHSSIIVQKYDAYN